MALALLRDHHVPMLLRVVSVGLSLLAASACDSGNVSASSVGSRSASPSAAADAVRTLSDGSAKCPVDVDAIVPADAARAYDAVLAYEKTDKAELVEKSVLTAARAGDWGGPVRLGCGAAIAERTFVVEARRTNAGNSESLAQSVTYVSHRGDSWFVWAEPH